MNEYDVHFLKGNLLKERKTNEWLMYKLDALSRSYEKINNEMEALKTSMRRNILFECIERDTSN